METIEGNKMTSETLSGVLSSQPSDELHKILKPSSENEAFCDEMKGVAAAVAGDGGRPVVVTKVIEKTEVTVVRVIQEHKDGNFENQEGKGFEQSFAEKNEGSEFEENEKEGVFGNYVGDDEGINIDFRGNGTSVVVDVKSPLADENGSEEKSGFTSGKLDENAPVDPMDVCLFKKPEEPKNDDKDNGTDLPENHDKQDEMEEDHNFVVGDFIWGKIKNHSWWPGRIHNPSNSSNHAANLNRKGQLLVSSFGDGSFSWCSPSQLKPFLDCFPEMSVHSDSKKFVNALQKALEEVHRLIEAELMCKCHPIDQIKEEVQVLKGKTVKLLIDRMQPNHILMILKAYATMEPGTRINELEHTFVEAWLAAFYRQKGGYFLQKYHDPMYIEGLEDVKRSRIRVDSDINGPSESADYGDDRSDRQRKQKTVAELLGKVVGAEDDEPKVKKLRTSKDGVSGIKRERKRKPLVVSVAATPESDHESGGIEDETMSPRQRRKSKYLSPPYLSPIWPGKLSSPGSGSFKEPKTEPEKSPQITDKQPNEPFKRASGRKPRGPDSQDSKSEQKTVIDASVNVNNVLDGLLTAALDPSEKKNLPEITTEFILSFRSSKFIEGSGQKKDPRMTLVIEFPPESPIPKSPDLSRTYKKFGDLIKTEVQTDKSRALIVFGNGLDAGKALKMSMEKKPFGEVDYYLSEECLAVEGLEYLKLKLEKMAEMVKRCGEDEMKAEVKAKLEEGIKEVIQKVG